MEDITSFISNSFHLRSVNIDSDEPEEQEQESTGIWDKVYSLIYPNSSDVHVGNYKPLSDFEKPTGTHHHFLQTSFTIPTYCNFCKELIWGFTHQGHTCAVCGYTSHSKCVKKAPLSCRPNIQVDTTPIGDDEKEVERLASTLFKHHFIEGNIPLGSECVVCKDSFELFSFTGFRCSRCDKMVHEECKVSLSSTLCKSKHQNLLYIPSKVFEQLKDETLQKSNTPLIVFINSRSGGQHGRTLIHELSRLLDKEQVFDLNADRGPEKGLLKFNNVANLRILVCGGDGTVGWVLSALDKFKFERIPPVAILPLGTGNDLARTLGWGTGYSGEEVSPILERVEDAIAVSLDRWKVSFESESGKAEEPKIMNNYMSVGVDAEVALKFHTLRNQQPELFSSQLVNKLWYAQFGFKAVFSDIDEVARFIDLEVDGNVVAIPTGIAGIMIVNLPSYGGGVSLWGDVEDQQYKTQRIDDKLLEIVGITSSFHFGTITVNLSQAVRIAQGSSIKVRLRRQLPVQVDGEPWLQDPATVSVTFFNQARMLYKSNLDRAMFRSMSHTNLQEQENSAEIKLLTAQNKKLRLDLEIVTKELELERSRRIKAEEELQRIKSKLEGHL